MKIHLGTLEEEWRQQYMPQERRRTSRSQLKNKLKLKAFDRDDGRL